jgi:hypothetical protein
MTDIMNPSAGRRLSGWRPPGLALLAWVIYPAAGPAWALPGALAATVWAAWLLARSMTHSGLRLKWRWVWGATLVFSVPGTALFLHQSTHQWVWRRTFQFSDGFARYQDLEGWSVLHPAAWPRQEERTSTSVTHLFKPQGVTPPMSFSITRRHDVGTQDLSLIVEHFLLNLPPDGKAEILEREPVQLPSGLQGFRVLYWTPAGRIPLKNDVLFVMDKGTFFFLSVEAGPRWFDRHRAELEQALMSLQPPAN